MTHPRTRATAILSVALASLALTFAPASAAPAPPAPITPAVEIATLVGSGCPPGTVTATPVPDGFTIKYSGYTARTGGDAKPTDARKNCQVALKVTVPEGLTYTVERVDFHGSGHLEPAATGTVKSLFYFSGSPSTGPIRREIRGPLAGEWRLTERLIQLLWPGCGEERNLNLNTELRVTAPDTSKPNSFGLNSDLRTSYHLGWKTCP
ncbi:DUF4360 domain-containing protein [Actinomadura sp. KC216]|uniref:DUF4360 domain-containing protein n=1 Tax=Actinomadura sp. KC216 TaxID=2530370 RepID=UPI001048CBC5|nr:DUF4360 domain-containing protein [Actinomadura sp. KC216]TDB88282.1 DUF4360 domain-containing protein [Actinomadura sp. KC216]